MSLVVESLAWYEQDTRVATRAGVSDLHIIKILVLKVVSLVVNYLLEVVELVRLGCYTLQLWCIRAKPML